MRRRTVGILAFFVLGLLGAQLATEAQQAGKFFKIGALYVHTAVLVAPCSYTHPMPDTGGRAETM